MVNLTQESWLIVLYEQSTQVFTAALKKKFKKLIKSFNKLQKYFIGMELCKKVSNKFHIYFKTIIITETNDYTNITI